jgi:hypothetical protein
MEDPEAVLELSDLEIVNGSKPLVVSCLDMKPVSVGISEAEAIASLS